MDNWRLSRVDDIEWRLDKSGVSVLINWDTLTDSVRLDVMAGDNKPAQSFIGKADNVRKALTQWLDTREAANAFGFDSDCRDWISLEHAAYIGSELERCDTERIYYIQS